MSVHTMSYSIGVPTSRYWSGNPQPIPSSSNGGRHMGAASMPERSAAHWETSRARGASAYFNNHSNNIPINSSNNNNNINNNNNNNNNGNGSSHNRHPRQQQPQHHQQQQPQHQQQRTGDSNGPAPRWTNSHAANGSVSPSGNINCVPNGGNTASAPLNVGNNAMTMSAGVPSTNLNLANINMPTGGATFGPASTAAPDSGGRDIEDELGTQNLYKTELCRSFLETGNCRYGSKCQFAHGAQEMRPLVRHPKYKTDMCKTFHNVGTCPYGKRCRFVHTRSGDPQEDPLYLDPYAVAAMNAASLQKLAQLKQSLGLSVTHPTSDGVSPRGASIQSPPSSRYWAENAGVTAASPPSSDQWGGRVNANNVNYEKRPQSVPFPGASSGTTPTAVGVGSNATAVRIPMSGGRSLSVDGNDPCPNGPGASSFEPKSITMPPRSQPLPMGNGGGGGNVVVNNGTGNSNLRHSNEEGDVNGRVSPSYDQGLNASSPAPEMFYMSTGAVGDHSPAPQFRSPRVQRSYSTTNSTPEDHHRQRQQQQQQQGQQHQEQQQQQPHQHLQVSSPRHAQVLTSGPITTPFPPLSQSIPLATSMGAPVGPASPSPSPVHSPYPVSSSAPATSPLSTILGATTTNTNQRPHSSSPTPIPTDGGPSSSPVASSPSSSSAISSSTSSCGSRARSNSRLAFFSQLSVKE